MAEVLSTHVGIGDLETCGSSHKKGSGQRENNNFQVYLEMSQQTPCIAIIN
jgi:hypothetical protein